MKDFRLFLLILILTSSAAIAAPQPIPPPKAPYATSLTVTQGLVIRTLTVPNASCAHYTDTPDANGLHRITLAQPDANHGLKPCVANGSYLSISQNAGPMYPQWIYPAPPPVCAPMPGPVTTTKDCAVTNPGTTGSWTQTATYGPASPQVPPDGCWVLGTPAPAVAPAGACTTAPPPGQWTAPMRGSSFPMQTKPAKGVSFVGPYGMATMRATDHTADVGQSWLAVWYNRHQAFNADNSLFVVFQPNGYWDVYRTTDGAYVKRLAGPGGDCEFHWDEHDPDVAYYVPTNGGTVLYKQTISSNTHAVFYDFTAAVHALWPDATQCWSKSEGSPTEDGRFVGFMCEAIVGSNWITRGFVKLDLVAKSIVWQKTNTGDRPDNVTLTPSGRWFIISGLAPLGTTAYATDGSGASWNFMPGTEHTDTGKLSNGHDFAITEKYQDNDGPIVAYDLDTRATLPLHIPIYGNPIFDNDPPPGSTQNRCSNCAVWPSAKGFNKPGWAVISTSERAPSNVILANVESGHIYGVTAVYNVRGDYWDEAHCTVSRDLTVMACTMNFGHSLDNDVYITHLNPLPAN